MSRLAGTKQVKRYARAGEPFKFDRNPVYAFSIQPDGTIQSWMAFDPIYGPENEEQIEWHKKKGTPGAANWKVGVPVKVTA